MPGAPGTGGAPCPAHQEARCACPACGWAALSLAKAPNPSFLSGSLSLKPRGGGSQVSEALGEAQEEVAARDAPLLAPGCTCPRGCWLSLSETLRVSRGSLSGGASEGGRALFEVQWLLSAGRLGSSAGCGASSDPSSACLGLTLALRHLPSEARTALAGLGLVQLEQGASQPFPWGEKLPLPVAGQGGARDARASAGLGVCGAQACVGGGGAALGGSVRRPSPARSAPVARTW